MVVMPARSASAARAQESVVLPAPPFWESTARTLSVATGGACVSVMVRMVPRYLAWCQYLDVLTYRGGVAGSGVHDYWVVLVIVAV